MTQETLTKVQNAACREGIEIAIRREYSGRGMFGRTTIAVETDGYQDALFLAGQSRALKHDSMGKGYIVY